MNEKILYESMSAIDDDILLRSESVGLTKNDIVTIMEHENDDRAVRKRSYPRIPKRRLSVMLIAATMVLLLMGAGLAAILYGDSIQNWFAHYWKMMTGSSMSSDQTALIEHLSQEIGISKSIDGVTVTVDSATVGVDNFYLLVRVEGVKLSDRYNYGFAQINMEVSPDPLAELGGMGAYGLEFHGMDSNGAAIFLLDHDYVTMMGFIEDTRPLEILLTLSDFAKDPHVNEREILTEGTWDFHFTLERNQLPQEIVLPDTEVMVIDLEEKEEYTEVPVLFTNIVLTNTNLRFDYDYQEGSFSFDGRIRLYLKSGGYIMTSGGTGVPLKETGLLHCSYKWAVPVNLDEVAMVKIGETAILVQ